MRAAGINKARIFIIAVDDLERSITTAQYLHRNYPDLVILARARDRQHYYRLREVGVRHIWRETYLSSLDMSRESLQLLGISPEKARETIQTFRDYDDGLIERQQAIYDDEASMIASAQSAMTELESLFDEDIDKSRKLDLTAFSDALKSQTLTTEDTNTEGATEHKS